MYEKVKKYVRQHSMIGQQDMVITGVSGGADSVCLLCVLRKMREEMGFGLAAVHVNHCLRGAEADADEAYVRELCDEWKIPLMSVRRDMAGEAKERRLSEEEAGREIRREAYMEAVRQFSGTRIALAHHMDDNAETVLLNLSRGTGLKGMAGIRPVSGLYIRPLLALRRREIETWLSCQGISWRTDRTNGEDIYARNRIRKEVMPCLEHRINPRTAEHILELSRQMESLADYMERQTELAWEQCVRQTGGRYELDIRRADDLDEALLTYLLRRLLARAAGGEKDIGQVHVEALRQLMSRQSGRSADLPRGVRAVRQQDRLYIERRSTAAAAPERENFGEEETLLCEPGLPDGVYEPGPGIRLRIFTCEKFPDTFPELSYTKWFDYDIIKCTVVLRQRRPGDFLDIDDRGHRQKLKKYLINEKVPAEERNRIRLAAEGSQILWAVGYRQNQRYQVTRETRRILEISLRECGG